MLTSDTVASLAEGLTQYATSRRGPLSAPEFQIVSEYRPVNGPRSFDFNLIHESVWLNWDVDRPLPARVGVAEFSDLLIATAARWLPEHQQDPLSAIVGFTLLYDDLTAPRSTPGPDIGPDSGVTGAQTRVLMAADVDGRRYHLVLDADRPHGTVQVTDPGGPVPSTVNEPLAGSGGAALHALHHLVDLTARNAGRDGTDQPDPADRADTGPLVHGEIVTVRGDRWDEEQRAQLWVVVDDFDDYAIAVLGGDGYQWRRVPRRDLAPVTPTWIRREVRADATYCYADADTTTPTPVDETSTPPPHQAHISGPPADRDGRPADIPDAS